MLDICLNLGDFLLVIAVLPTQYNDQRREWFG